MAKRVKEQRTPVMPSRTHSSWRSPGVAQHFVCGEIALAAKAAEGHRRPGGAHRDDHVARAIALQFVGGRRLQMEVGDAAPAEGTQFSACGGKVIISPLGKVERV